MTTKTLTLKDWENASTEQRGQWLSEGYVIRDEDKDEFTTPLVATFGYDGSWYVVVYRGDTLVARSPDFYLRLEAERWALTNYIEATWDHKR